MGKARLFAGYTQGVPVFSIFKDSSPGLQQIFVNQLGNFPSSNMSIAPILIDSRIPILTVSGILNASVTFTQTNVSRVTKQNLGSLPGITENRMILVNRNGLQTKGIDIVYSVEQTGGTAGAIRQLSVGINAGVVYVEELVQLNESQGTVVPAQTFNFSVVFLEDVLPA